MELKPPSYLLPYIQAAAYYGSAFESLLWSSPLTQRRRFEALIRISDLTNRSVLDVGCGRADLLDFLSEQNISLASYVGIEAIEPLAKAAAEKPGAREIIREDFVKNPDVLFVGAQVLFFSGSLTTLENQEFFEVLRQAYAAAGEVLVFNFLISKQRNSNGELFWRDPTEVIEFSRSLGKEIRVLDDYLREDMTISIQK